MKVKDLIGILKQCDENSLVTTPVSYQELREVSSVLNKQKYYGTDKEIIDHPCIIIE